MGAVTPKRNEGQNQRIGCEVVCLGKWIPMFHKTCCMVRRCIWTRSGNGSSIFPKNITSTRYTFSVMLVFLKKK